MSYDINVRRRAFVFDGDALKDSVDFFNLLVQQKEMLGEKRVMNMLREELVSGLSEVEDIELGDWEQGLIINKMNVKIGFCLKDSDKYYIHDLVKRIGVKSFLILVQLPNEYAYNAIYYPFETTGINEEWELCHVAKGFRRFE